jgi:hypothetical protein
MVFACSSTPGERQGLRLIKGEVDGIVERLGIPAEPDRRPRYFAENAYVVVTATKRRMTLEQAWAEANDLLLTATCPSVGTLADAAADELQDIIRAMREAGTPTPPAAMAKAA